MRIHDPKYSNMTHALSLSIFNALKGTNFNILLTAYGLTETGPTTHYDSAPTKKGTVGHILPNTIAKVQILP